MEGINFINSGVASVIYNVLIPKLFPSTMVDKISSGMEIQRDIVETGIPNTVEQTRERPVIPPGASPVEVKKKLTATAVMAAANVIHP